MAEHRSASRLSAILLGLSAAALLVITAVIGWQVFGRFVLGSSPTWAEQLALVLMIALVFFGMAAGVEQDFHIRITLLLDLVSPATARRLGQLSLVVILLMGAAMAWWGLELVRETWRHAIPSLGIPRGAAYLPLPAAGLLISLFAARGLARRPGPR